MKQIFAALVVVVVLVTPCLAHSPGTVSARPAQTPSLYYSGYKKIMARLNREYGAELPDSIYVIEYSNDADLMSAGIRRGQPIAWDKVDRGHPLFIWRWQPAGSIIWQSVGEYSTIDRWIPYQGLVPRNLNGYLRYMSVSPLGTWYKFYY